MRTRHRVPTIFNLSMVDVLCCALGCVLLLWLLNLREAKERATAVGKTSEQLQATLTTLSETEARLRAANEDRDRIDAELKATRARVVSAFEQAAKLAEEKQAVADRLIKLSRDHQSLGQQKADLEEQLTDVNSRIKKQEDDVKLLTRGTERLMDRLRDADAKLKDLQEQADQVPLLRKEAEGFRSKLADAEARALGMQAGAGERDKQLALANQTIAGLRDEKKALSDQVRRARAAAENRFEGIALTGRRVVFLVDMSGSMELLADRIPEPTKWTGVRETLAKIMRSLPDLEKFQVLVFSERCSYLVGNDGKWLDYDAKKSVDEVLNALAQTRPRGGTNMYDAFEQAFRLRAVGLDTIYVLSDGLPNMGPGLTPEQANNPKETERSEILARYIRDLLRRDWNRTIAGQPRVRINTVGFFFESPDVGAFLWALARENDGSFVGMSKP
jgi:hypothetical protein